MSRHAALRQLALTALANRAGPAASADAIAAAADRAYGELARVLAPVIGDVGVAAITDRALHLAQREYPWLRPTREQNYTEGKYREEKFSEFVASLKGQDAAMATDAAAAGFATFLGLLTTFIGDPLATRLVRQAWPDTASSALTEET